MLQAFGQALIQHHPTCCNISKQGGQTYATSCAQQCCTSVWSGLDPTSSNMLQHIETGWPNVCNKLCPTMSHERLVRPWSNIIQHVATYRNRVAKRMQQVVPNNVARAFGQALIQHHPTCCNISKQGGQTYATSCAQQCCTSVWSGLDPTSSNMLQHIETERMQQVVPNNVARAFGQALIQHHPTCCNISKTGWPNVCTKLCPTMLHERLVRPWSNIIQHVATYRKQGGQTYAPSCAQQCCTSVWSGLDPTSSNMLQHIENRVAKRMQQVVPNNVARVFGQALIQHHPTCCNISKQGGQTYATSCAQQCCTSVWSGLDPTSSNMLQHIETGWPNVCTKLCPTMLHERLVRPWSNIIQHVATYRNRVAKRMQQVVPNNVARAFGQALIQHVATYRNRTYAPSCAQQCCTSVWSGLDPTSSNMLQHIETGWPNVCNKLCPTMLHERLVRPWSNIIQHVATYRNRVAKRMQQVVPNNVARAFGQALIQHHPTCCNISKQGGQTYATSCAQQCCTSVWSGLNKGDKCTKMRAARAARSVFPLSANNLTAFWRCRCRSRPRSLNSLFVCGAPSKSHANWAPVWVSLENNNTILRILARQKNWCSKGKLL